jgi:hypothetical protein
MKTRSESAYCGGGTEESANGKGCSSWRRLWLEEEVVLVEEELVEKVRDVMVALILE